AERGIDLSQCGSERLQLLGHRACAFLVRTADEDEVLRSSLKPRFICRREGDGTVRLPRCAVPLDALEDGRDELGMRREGEEHERKREATHMKSEGWRAKRAL